MIPFLSALFVLGPIAEIYVLLKAGQAFGALPVVATCLLTAALGGYLIRLQGFAALNSAQRDLDEGRAPVEAVADGVCLILAAPLLMTPGFITDVLGFALLIPPARRAAARAALKWIRSRLSENGRIVTIRRRS